MVVQPSNVYSDEPDTNCSELAHCTDEELETQAAEILYDQPVSLLEVEVKVIEAPLSSCVSREFCQWFTLMYIATYYI